jgi:UDP-glucose 4-epimerase
MRVVVTGGSGFLGSFIVERLQDRGHTVHVLDLKPPVWTADAEWIEVDTADQARIADVFGSLNPQAVVHLAGLLGTSETFDHPQRTVQTNVVGTINVLEACRGVSGIRYVGVQTGTPWLSPYAISKRTATEFAQGYHRAFGISATILKVFNAYGPRQDGTGDVTKIVPRFTVNALRRIPLPIFGDGRQVIDLVHVESCAECFARALEHAPGRGEVIEVGSGVPITVREVAKRIIAVVGRGEVEFLPPRVGEGPEYPVADTTLARDLLGFTPAAELDRLPETVAWYEATLDRWVDARGKSEHAG